MNALVGTGLSAVLLLTTLAVASEAQTSGLAAAPRVIFVCEAFGKAGLDHVRSC